MAEKLTVIRIDNALGIVLPKEIRHALNVREGDELYAKETDDGIILTSLDPDFEDALENARQFMDTHADALRELAKR